MDNDDLLAFASHEADLIWSRYNAMVVADTIFIAAIAAITTNTGLAFAGSCVGIILTAIWWILTSAGWALSHAMLDAIGQGDTGTNKTPVRVYQDWRSRVWPRCYADPIWWLAHAVIGMFYLVYAALAVYFGRLLFGSTFCALTTIGLAALLLLCAMLHISRVRLSVGSGERPDPPIQPAGSARG